MPFVSVAEAIEEIRAGRILVVVDDEDRENEGDLTIAAEKVTPEIVNFMVTHGHEIDDLGRHLFGGNGEVAFVLAVLVVHHDQDAPGADFFDGLGYGDEGHDSL